MKILVENMTEPGEVRMSKFNSSNRAHGSKKLGENSTAVSSVPIRPKWKWTKVGSIQAKSSLDKTTIKSVNVHQKTANKKEILRTGAGNQGYNRTTKLSQGPKPVPPKSVTALTSGQKGEEKKPCPCQGEKRMQRHPIRPHNQKPGQNKPSSAHT